MAYGAVALALVFTAGKAYSGKKTSTLVTRPSDSFLFNLVRMLICILIGLAVVLAESAQHDFRVERNLLAICLFAGMSNVALLIGWMLAVQKCPLITVEVTMAAGSMIPAALSAWLFAEPIAWQKMLGYGLVVLSAVILSGYQKNTVEKSGLAGIALVILATAGDGLTGFSQQLYRQYYTENGIYAREVFYPVSIYQFYTFVFSALILLVCFGVYCAKRFLEKTPHTNASAPNQLFRTAAKALPLITVMAICIFAVNYFQTLATGKYGMSPQILYPVIRGGSLIITTVNAMLFFGEKPTRRSILGTLTAFAGILAINIL